jgi:pimeloyl-ACP methyl ester carboxylesterase
LKQRGGGGGVHRRPDEGVLGRLDVASCLTNHFVIDFGVPGPRGLGDIEVPTLVVHGERDPVFPLAHGQALRNGIPGADLLVMEKAGHELPPPVWDVFVPRLVQYTAR